MGLPGFKTDWKIKIWMQWVKVICRKNLSVKDDKNRIVTLAKKNYV